MGITWINDKFKYLLRDKMVFIHFTHGYIHVPNPTAVRFLL